MPALQPIQSLTVGGSDVQNWGIQTCVLLYCNLQIWLVQHKIQEELQFRVGSRSHQKGFPPSPAGKTAFAWCLGSAPQTHLQGRTWHGIWTAEGSLSWHPEQRPDIERQGGGGKRSNDREQFAEHNGINFTKLLLKNLATDTGLFQKF